MIHRSSLTTHQAVTAPRSRSGRVSSPHLPFHLRVALLGMTALAGGCSLAPESRTPAPVAVVPDSYQEAELAGAYEPVRWWAAFEDPVLDGLVEEALDDNLDLKEAVARLMEVRAQERMAESALWPVLSGSAQASQQSSPANTGTFGALGGGGGGEPSDTTGGSGGDGGSDGEDGIAPPDRFSITTYTASLALAYELDFWGRVRNDARAASLDALAAGGDLQAARLGVIGQVIQTYFEVVDLRRRIEVAVELVDLLTERVELAEDRYARGLVSSFELLQIRQDFRNTQAGLPLLEAQLADAEGRLSVLLGDFSGPLTPATDSVLPRLVLDPVPTGLPAELLVQRPDVRAAALRFEAARYRIGARRAELFPSISLSTSLGVQSDEPGGLLDVMEQWTRNLSAGLTAPLFQGGRLRAQVDAAEATYLRLGAVFSRTFLTAFREVETSLEQYEEQRQRYAFLRAQAVEAEASVTLQARRYRSGVGGYTDYLDALRTLYQVETSLSQAGRDAAMARLAVHRALGGGWAPLEPGEPLPGLELVDVPLGEGE